MTPEDQARQNIDPQLTECGWIVQDFAAMNIMAGLDVAVREFRLNTGSADYGLYMDGKRITDQIIDTQTPDHIIEIGYGEEAKERAKTLIISFRQFIEDNKDEIEAINILYSRPYAAGLRYSQIKDLARRLSIKPFHVDESQPQTLLKLWQAFGAVDPDKVDTNGKHRKHIVDLVALVRHAIDPDSPLRPVGMTVEERFTEWLSDQQSSGGEFTGEQMQWLVAIKDHIASSLMIEQDDFEYALFNQFGGIGRAYELFGDRLAEIMGDAVR